MTKATYTIKSFFGHYSFRGLEYTTAIMAGSMAAGGQTWCWSSENFPAPPTIVEGHS